MIKLTRLVLLWTLISGAKSPAQGEALPGVRGQLKALDEKAASLNQGSLQSIDDYLSTALSTTIFSSASGVSVSRCIKTERAFRAKLTGPVRERDVVTALNNVMKTLAVPGSSVVSEEQLHMLRVQMLLLLPNFLSSPTRTSDHIVTDELSPAAALYIASLLLQQKMTNPGGVLI